MLKERFGKTSVYRGVKTLVEKQGHLFLGLCLRVGVWNIAFGEHQAYVPKVPCTNRKRLYPPEERLQKALPALYAQGKLPFDLFVDARLHACAAVRARPPPPTS